MVSTRIKEILSTLPYVYEDFVNKDGKETKDVPDDYVVFMTDITNTGEYADGQAFIRYSSCQIDVLSKGVGNKTLANQVEELLKQNEINYIKLNLGYLSDIKKTQITFDFKL